MGKFEDIKFYIISKKSSISEKEEDFLGRRIVKSTTPVQTFLTVPYHLRSAILCELAYLRSANAEERLTVANNTPKKCVKDITVPSFMLKMVKRDYTTYDKLNFEILRKPENREYALKIKLRYYEEVTTRQKSISWAYAQTGSDSLKDELDVLNGRLALLEEEDISGYAVELRGIIEQKQAERREKEEFATKRAEEILAIGAEVRQEREAGKPAKSTKTSKPGTKTAKQSSPLKTTSELIDEDEINSLT